MTEDNGSRTHEPSLRELTADLDGLRELMDERDRRYGTVAQDAKEAVRDALSAQKELTAAAFAASEKAIDKAEGTSATNDAKNNEFRAQLRDQAATFLSRPEADARFKGIDDRLMEEKRQTRAAHDFTLAQAIALVGVVASLAGAITFLLRTH